MGKGETREEEGSERERHIVRSHGKYKLKETGVASGLRN